MFSGFERLVALRYLRARRQDGFISVIAWFSLLGIALGVGTLIVVTAVMNGFQAELIGRVLGLNGDVTVFAPSAQGIPGYDGILARIRQLPGVADATPMVQGQAMATAKGAAGAVIRGLSVEDLKARRLLADGIVAGALDQLGDDGVAIGSGLADRLGVTLGSPITLITASGPPTPSGPETNASSFRVAAIFTVGMIDYDSGYVYMPLETAQAFLQLPGLVNAIEVIVPQHERAGRVAGAVRGLVPRADRVVDWQQAYAGFFQVVQTQRNVLFLILSLIILVAAFNIVSSMIMLVKGKGRDIAILRTLGASRGAILRIFLMAGASVGAIGTATGLVLGIAFADHIEAIRQWIQDLTGTQLFAPQVYFLSKLPARIDYGEVAQIVVLALALSVLATIYPSWRAARFDPVEALRYE